MGKRVLHSGDYVSLTENRIPMRHRQIWTLQWCHFFSHTMPDIYKKYQGAADSVFIKEMEELVEVLADLCCGRIGQLCAGYENQ